MLLTVSLKFSYVGSIVCALELKNRVLEMMDCKNNLVKTVFISSRNSEEKAILKNELIKKLANEYIDTKDNRYKEKRDVIWMLKGEKSESEDLPMERFITVGSNNSIYNMFNNDIGPDIVKFLEKGSKHERLFSYYKKFSFIQIDIDKTLKRFKTDNPHIWRALDDELYEALTKEFENREPKLNAVEALLAFCGECKTDNMKEYLLWNPAKRSGEMIYYKKIENVMKDETSLLERYQKEQLIEQKMEDFLCGRIDRIYD